MNLSKLTLIDLETVLIKIINDNVFNVVIFCESEKDGIDTLNKIASKFDHANLCTKPHHVNIKDCSFYIHYYGAPEIPISEIETYLLKRVF